MNGLAALRAIDPLVGMPDTAISGANLHGGVWHQPSGCALIEVRSPYNGELLGSVPDSDAAEVAAIVAAAQQAATGWAAMPIKERTVPMFRFRELVLQRLEDLAHSAARECGKTVSEARAGVQKGVEVVE